MTYLIDSHEDIACSALSFNRDLCLSAHETRQREQGTQIPEWNHGETLLGWPDYQRGRVALIFSTLFCAPAQYSGGIWDVMSYKDTAEAGHCMRRQFDYYHRLTGEHPDKFRLVCSRSELDAVLHPWEEAPDAKHPVGLTLLLENAEGLASPHLLEEYYEAGLRLVGPIWAGTRYCGGTKEDRLFDDEARALLEVMVSLKLPLDVSHMRPRAALAALDFYPGTVLASHANALAMVKGSDSPRHLTDEVIDCLLERDAVIGVVPFNKFLSAEWDYGSPREKITLATLTAQIDYLCQRAGSSQHVGIGTDFDGGFGFPNVPLEIDTIADLQKLHDVLAKMGYTADDIENIFHRNWQRFLEKTLPA